MSEVRAPRAFALLNRAMHDPAVGCWGVKYTYFNPRPVELDPGITTVIGLPNFPAYPSGHSTFSAAAAMVLSYLFPQAAPDFDAMKDEARDRKSTRLNSSHGYISYAVFCLKKKKNTRT